MAATTCAPRYRPKRARSTLGRLPAVRRGTGNSLRRCQAPFRRQRCSALARPLSGAPAIQQAVLVRIAGFANPSVDGARSLTAVPRSRLIHTDPTVCTQRVAHLSITQVAIEPVGIEVAAGPPLRVAMFGMLRVSDNLQKVLVTTWTADVLRRPRTSAVDAARPTGSGFEDQ
jgi:hypothetical protein